MLQYSRFPYSNFNFNINVLYNLLYLSIADVMFLGLGQSGFVALLILQVQTECNHHCCQRLHV